MYNALLKSSPLSGPFKSGHLDVVFENIKKG